MADKSIKLEELDRAVKGLWNKTKGSLLGGYVRKSDQGNNTGTFAYQGRGNNFIYSGNEFNFIPKGMNQAGLWFNYRTTGGYDPDTKLTQYILGNGNKGTAYLVANGFMKEGYDDNYLLLADGGVIHHNQFLQRHVNNPDANNLKLGVASVIDGVGSALNRPNGYGTLVSFQGHYSYFGQMFFYPADGRVWFRAASGTNWTPWRQLAYIDSNVASAGKLTIPRLLWGQPFDGTGNVDGLLTINNQQDSPGLIIKRANEGLCALQFDINGKKWTVGHFRGDFIVHFGSGGNLFGVSESGTFFTKGGLYSLPNGNVGIGTASPAYKLHVNGAMYADRVYLYDGVYLHRTAGGTCELVGANLKVYNDYVVRGSSVAKIEMMSQAEYSGTIHAFDTLYIITS